MALGFDNLRNEDLNANSWANNCVACGTAAPRQKYRYNYVGGNLGGPIKKNKIFFFYNFEDFIQTTPIQHDAGPHAHRSGAGGKLLANHQSQHREAADHL